MWLILLQTDGDLLPATDVKVGMWVLVEYEMEKFIGRILEIDEGQFRVHCLAKPYGIRTPQEFEREKDAIFYKQVFNTKHFPKEVQVCRKLLWEY